MGILATTLLEVLQTKSTRVVEGKDVERVFQQYFVNVQQPLEELRQERLKAAEDNRFVTCR